MDLTLLPVLKSKLLTEKKLARVWEYFMDNFGDHLKFIEESEKIPTSAEIEKILSQVSIVLYQGPVTISDFKIMGFPEDDFYHGVVNTAKGDVSFIYFDDIHVGSTLHFTGSYSGETRFSRFACEVLPDGSVKASIN